MYKPTIFITNDDSVNALGIKTLIEWARPFGNVYVVAPDAPRSGAAHSITTATPLRLKSHVIESDFEVYSVNGTPVDCVKMAMKIVLKKRRPDILLSGINHGSNASVNLLYSGTMAAAIEGCMCGIPSVGFSLDDFSPQADFDPFKSYVESILTHVLEKGISPGVCLNVNFPAVPKQEIKGIKVCRQGLGYWNEDFEERTDPFNRKYYWMQGDYVPRDSDGSTDDNALKNNFVTVAPVKFDLTDYHSFENLVITHD